MRQRLPLLFGLFALSSISQGLGWVGNTKLWQSGWQIPNRGAFLEPWQTLTLTTETWPIESGQSVYAVVTTNNWQTTQEYEFTWDGNVGNNSKWYRVLGPFPQGAQVNVYLRAQKTGQANPFYDNNGTLNFGFLQRFASPYRRGPILQWFATPYRTIVQRLPEVVSAGYSAIYLPAPSKAGGGGFSVGYNPVDRFDLGDRLQKGTVRTQYGTTQELIDLIQVAKRLGLEVYVDAVFNHNDNRASHPINQYPDMIPEDFHIRSSADTGNTEINFNNESAFSFGMLNHDLVGLTDIAHEDGNNTQTGVFNLPSYAASNVWGKPSFVRQPLTPQYYPNGQLANEDVREYLERWAKWMVGAIGVDGFRLDAVKHVGPGYWGWAPDQAASQGFSNGNLLPRLFGYDPNLFIFGEDYTSGSYELREYAKTGMHLLDFPLVFKLRDIFNSQGLGNLGAALGNGYSPDGSTGLFYQQGGLSPDVGVSFVQSHDDGPPQSNNIAHAFILGRPGRAKVYFDGNNVLPGNWSNFPRPGRYDALGAGSDLLKKLVDANARFGRGYSVSRIATSTALVFERQVNGKGIALVGLNSRGDNTSQTHTVSSGFSVGTILRDYGGQRPDVTVGANGQVTITVPSNFSSTDANNGRGYVFYAPLTASAVPGVEPVQFTGASPKSKYPIPLVPVTVATPNGQYGPSGAYKRTELTSAQTSLVVRTDSAGNSAVVKIDNGVALPGTTLISGSAEGLADGFIPMSKLADGSFKLENADFSGLADGLHIAKVRVFSNTGADPGAYADFDAFFTLRRGLATGWVVDGELSEYGSPITSQSRNASNNNNRLDALYAANDDRYLYLGFAGRSETQENQTFGFGAFLDTDNSGSTGLNAVNQLADDSGPTPRLLSNNRLTMPTGFGADIALGAFRNSSSTSSPEALFLGGQTTAPLVGSQGGIYRVNSANLTALQPIPGMIATKPRINKTDAPRGYEVAIPLSELYASGLPSGNQLKLIAFSGDTGELGSFLTSTDSNRATLGGRPLAQSWLNNQFLPTQANIFGDPGRSPLTLIQSQSVSLQFGALAGSGVVLTPSGLEYDAQRGVYRQTVLIANGSGVSLNGPISLRMALPSGVTLVEKTGNSLLIPGRVYKHVTEKRIPVGGQLKVELEYASSIGGSFAPGYELLSGRGIR